MTTDKDDGKDQPKLRGKDVEIRAPRPEIDLRSKGHITGHPDDPEA